MTVAPKALPTELIDGLLAGYQKPEALDFSVNLQHKRTANFRDAAMCVEATTAVVNTIAIVSGRRDPQQSA